MEKNLLAAYFIYKYQPKVKIDTVKVSLQAQRPGPRGLSDFLT
jgi:hypothetical protein